VRVLEQTKWRIEGPKGAALILGLHPSTVRSRMLKLGIRKENGTRTARSFKKEQNQNEQN
jgi:transcriptional regulator with GAF, ATPase, and Fis domain